MRSPIVSRATLLPLTTLVGLAGLAGAACGQGEPAPSLARETTEQAIYGGSTTTKYPFVLGMVSLSGPGGICTATLIAPNLALTARHCISDTNSDNIDCRSSRFTTDSAKEDIYLTTEPVMQQHGDFYGVKKIFLPSNDDMCGHDLALLMLDDNIPESVAKPAIPKIHEKITDGTGIKQITAIGYGISDPADEGGQTAGTRRIREDIDVICAYGYPNASRDCDGLDPQQQALLLSQDDVVVAEGTCQGDSGSSAFEQDAFDDGEFYSVGVLSRGAAGTCEVGVYTRVDAFKELIIEAATEAAEDGNYDPPAWIVAPGEPQPNSSSSGGPEKIALGGACEENAECTSELCAEIDGAKLCTAECTDTCEDEGFECNGDGYCVAIVESSSSSGEAKSKKGSGEKSGCSVSSDPTKPIPWRNGAPAAALAFGVALLLRRRSSR